MQQELTRFDVEPAQAALIGTAFGLPYAPGVLLFDPLSDRYRRKRPRMAVG